MGADGIGMHYAPDEDFGPALAAEWSETLDVSVFAAERLAAFALDASSGGNPAGVVVLGDMPEPAAMQRLAAELGYSETVFAAPEHPFWRTRYFAPSAEVPFCGHATVALGAALTTLYGPKTFPLRLNSAAARVEGEAGAHDLDEYGALGRAALISPPTWSRAAAPDEAAALQEIFGVDHADLAQPPAIAHAGASHLVFELADGAPLANAGADWTYNMDAARRRMNCAGVTTVMLAHRETEHRVHVRNAFAPGGLAEDPATGASAAAYAGLLRDRGAAPADGRLEILQGAEMGMPSRIDVRLSREVGAGVRVSGLVRRL